MPSNTPGGGPYYVTAKAGQPIKNNGGTVLYGGNINTTLGNVTNSLTYAQNTAKTAFSRLPGQYVPTAGTYGARSITAAIVGRRYGKMASGKYVMARFTPEIAGVASTLFNSGASDFGRLPYAGMVSNRIRTQRILMNGGWNLVTGKVALGFGRNSFGDPINVEAFPTRSIPGRLTYATSGVSRTTQNYSVKTD